MKKEAVIQGHFVRTILAVCTAIAFIGIALAQWRVDDKPEFSMTVLKHRDLVPRKVAIPDSSTSVKLDEIGFKHPKLFQATKDPREAETLEAHRQEARIALSDPDRFVESTRNARSLAIESVRNEAQRRAMWKVEEALESDRQEALAAITKPHGREEQSRAQRNSKELQQEAFSKRAILRPEEVLWEIESQKTQTLRDREQEALNALSVANEFWAEENHLRDFGTRRPSKIESNDRQNSAPEKGGRP